MNDHLGTRIIKSLLSIISKMIAPFQRCFKKSSSEKCLLNKMPECPSTLSTRVPKCPSRAWVSQVLECPSAKCLECPTAQVPFECPSALWVPKCPLSAQVSQVFECLSALSAQVPLECPLSALRVLKCPLSDHRVPFQCPNPLWVLFK